jgi:hypothetical protein
LKSFDFGAEADAAVSVWLIAHMDDPRGTAYFLGRVPRYFRGHAQSRFDGHTNLQGSRRGKEEAATGNI